MFFPACVASLAPSPREKQGTLLPAGSKLKNCLPITQDIPYPAPKETSRSAMSAWGELVFCKNSETICCRTCLEPVEPRLKQSIYVLPHGHIAEPVPFRDAAVALCVRSSSLAVRSYKSAPSSRGCPSLVAEAAGSLPVGRLGAGDCLLLH